MYEKKPGKFTNAGPNIDAGPKYLKHPIGGANTKCMEKPGKFTKAGPNTDADPKYLKHPIGGANTKCAQRHFEILKILPLPYDVSPLADVLELRAQRHFENFQILLPL